LNDILWKRLCFHHPEFMWRSKMLNGVNKWWVSSFFLLVFFMY
jgi:acetylglutamate synthase